MDEVTTFVKQRRWYHYHLFSIFLTVVALASAVLSEKSWVALLGAFGTISVGATALIAGRTAIVPKGYQYLREDDSFLDGYSLTPELKAFMCIIIALGFGAIVYIAKSAFWGP